jgi:hypothetical protein
MGYPYVTIIPGKNETKLASALYSGASGVQAANVLSTVSFQLDNAALATKAAASAYVVLWSQARTNASIVLTGNAAKFQLGPNPYLALFSASSNGATVLKASAGSASFSASGIYTGQPYTVTMRSNEGRVDVWINSFTQFGLAASPVLSASSADLTPIGWFALAANEGSGEANLSLTNISAYILGAGSSDIGARETFRFESYPEGRVYQGNASIFQFDRLAAFRGGFPQIPPTGSSMATGPARVVALQGEIDNIVGNDGMDISLFVQERFRFLR